MYPHSLCTSLEGTVRPNPTFAKVQKIIFIFERIMRPISNFAKEQKKILLSLKEVWEYNNYHLASWKNCETDQPPSPVLLLTVQSPVTVTVTVTVTVSSSPTYCAQEQKTNEPPNWGLAWNRKMSTFPELTENSKVWAPFVSVSLNQTLHCWKHVLFLPNTWCFYKTGGKLQKTPAKLFSLEDQSWLTKLGAD